MNARWIILLFTLGALHADAGSPVEDFIRGLFSRSDQYVALGKIMTAPPTEGAGGYYAAHLRTLQSSSLLEAARARVAKAHPEVPASRVEIKVMRTEGSMIFRVASVGEGQKYTRMVLDALLDEFMAKQTAALMADKKDCLARLLQELSSAELKCLEIQDKVAAGKAADAGKQEQELQQARTRYEAVKDRLANYDVARELDQQASIIERPMAAISTR